MSVVIERESGERWQADAYVSSGWSPEVAVSDHPRARGASATDHARPQPLVFTVVIEVTRTPFRPTPAVLSVDRIAQARDFLTRCQGELLTLTIPGVGVYEDVLLTGHPHELVMAGGVRFELGIKAVQVPSETTTILPRRKAVTGATPPDPGGEVPTKEIKPGSPKEVKLKSALARLRDTDRGGQGASFLGIADLTAPTE